MVRAYTALTICVAIWGSNFVFGKMLVQDFSPSLLTTLRLFFIVLLLFGLSLHKPLKVKLKPSEWVAVIALGVVGIFMNQWSFYKGLETADPTTAALILATTPIVTGFLASIFLKEKITLPMLGGSVVAITGIYFVVSDGKSLSLETDKGLMWITVTMVSFAIMIIMTRGLSLKFDPLTITLYSNIVGFIVSIPFVFLLDNPLQMSTRFSSWALLIGTAIIVHGIATLMWNNYIRYVNAARAAILSNLEPFIAMVMGLILLSKPITGVELIGSLFIVGGVVLSTYQRRKRLAVSYDEQRE
ncbi:DMT family transporter [Pseudogracilibacillus auburnensis]|uniref:DMT family transporter n=1 Tax=Pseudogracilibacillus auburnensis TaxID=1494959 RepID=UPI001A975172|nr:DMT family transporter [Pseudogracilibacillus auburnensis]MBO1004001.1 DMT family transporter [Pseudogracilibacillus auburnensis]